MSNRDGSIGRRTHNMKGWALHMAHHVASTGNSEARQAGKRRFQQDRRLAARAEPSDRRCLERREA